MLAQMLSRNCSHGGFGGPEAKDTPGRIRAEIIRPIIINFMFEYLLYMVVSISCYFCWLCDFFGFWR